MQSQHFYWPQARLLPANYKIFEVPVWVFARDFGNTVSAERPWDRGWYNFHYRARVTGSESTHFDVYGM
jgi:hypothetical protein